MAAPTDRAPLTSWRQQLQAKWNEVVDAAYQVRLAESALADAQRTGSADDETTAQNALTTAQDHLASLRSAESDLRGHLLTEIGHWLADDQTNAPLSVTDDLSRLEPNVPIILFPVRLETRFDPPLVPATATVPATTPTSLKVRIYPDEIFLNTHEPALTPEERQAGIDFYDNLILSDDNEHRQRWRDLTARFGPTRAAYIARVSMPPAEGQPDQRPTLATRGSAWTRPGEGVLPDRWVVIAYRGDTVRPIPAPNPIREPLAMTPDPAETTLVDVGDGMTVDKNLAWSLKFDEAVAAGMAVNIQLNADEAASGFDRLVVIGVKTSLSGDDTAALLEDLFDAHHYTRGVGIVSQGTPTNNTTDQPVRFPPDDPTGAVSFGFERVPVPSPGPAGPSPDAGNFTDITTFFGVADSVLRNIQNAMGSEQDAASFMNAVLWPATLGYYLQQILRPMPPTDLMTETGQPTFSPNTLALAQFYFAQFVRARGSAPVFRLGNVPYGILPALSLDRWIALGIDDGFSPEELLEGKIVGTLRILRNIWTTTASIPTFVGLPPTANPYDPLLRLLAQDANSKAIQLRPSSGPDLNALIRVFGGVDPAQSIAEFEKSAQKVATGIGQNSWQPRGFAFTFNEPATDFRESFVSKDVSDQPLDPDYITALADATMEQLRDDSIVTGDKPLLYLLLRHALLQQYLSTGLAVTPSTVPEKAGVPAEDPEFWFTDAAAPNPPKVVTLFQFLGAATTDADGKPTTVFENTKKTTEMVSYLTLLRSRLAKLSTRELQLALTEALDLCSHRLDGWICALAVRRLLEIRQSQIADPDTDRKPSYLGGYGWLENVRPASHPMIDPGNGVGLVEIQPHNGGFIHAPSMNHARTAAVLRAGQQVGRLDGDSKYAIDLSSERARRAGRLVDEIRNGQPLGALLGYQFEKGLADSGLPELQVRLHKLRNRFPLVANKRSDDPYQEIDTVAARDVVDGNLLLTAYKASPQSILNDPSVPQLSPAALTVLTAELERLKETMDAVADLVHAEAAFHVVQADVASAQANLDFLPHGQNPPEPAILNTDGGGISLTHRVALLFTQSPQEVLQKWPPTGSTARSAADPLIDAWLSLLLGDPHQLTATVNFNDKDGAAQPPKTIAVADLGLRPLDIVALAHAAADPNQASLLDRRILFKAFVPDWTSPLVTYNQADKARPGSIPEMVEMARAIGNVLANARALSRDDLHVPGEVGDVDQPPQTEADALVGRAKGAVQSIDGVISALSDPTTVVDGMAQSAQFLPNSFPLPGASADSLSDQKTGVIAELQRRRSLAISALPAADPAAPPPPPPPPPPSETIAAARSALQAIFGPDFIGLTGIGPPPSSDEVAKSLAARSTLIASDAVLDQFVQQTARVREGMGRWRRAALYARALGQSRARLDVLQLPHAPAENWVGNSVPAIGGKVSILLVSPTASAAPPTDATANWSGLFLDQWVETVPLSERETGVAFHYDHPNAEAPQAILIAVRSGAATTRADKQVGWSWDELLATVNETFDLTHIRTVEPQHLPLGQVLPAIHLVSNQQGYTPSTNFVEQVASPSTQGNS